MPDLSGARRALPIVFAVAMGSLAAWFAHQWISQQRQALESERQKLLETYKAPVKVVAASRDIPEGTVLEASHVKTLVVPEQFVQPYAVRAPAELLGRVAVAPIAEGEQVLLNKLRHPEEAPVGTTLSGLTPKGKRAVTIIVDTITGVGGFVRPADVVDILWTLKLPQPGQSEDQVVTLMLFQDVQVLAVGRELAGQPPKDRKDKADESAQFTVTLALTPQETSFLLFAREQGRIQLSLRPRSETGAQVSVVPANINTLMEAVLKVPAAPPPPPPKPTRQVEVYKGLQRDVVALQGAD